MCSSSKRWKTVKAVTGSTTTSTTVPPLVAYSPPTQPELNLASCMIREQNANREAWANALPSGFPRKTIAKKEGIVKWALIPIDFPDLVGQANFRTRVDDQMSLLSEWFAIASEGKFKVEWDVHISWV